VEYLPEPEPPAAVEAAAPDGSAEGGVDPEGAEAERDLEGAEAERDPLRFNNWMKRSATGAVMTGIAIGLREALEPRRPEVAFVIEASDPDGPDGPIDLHFDPDSPQNTVAVIRRTPPDNSGETPPV
jgi:hypothetical protein